MASIFTFNDFDYLNIDATVGEDGVNNHDDVYLVQAFLFSVLHERYMGLSLIRPPLPSGTFNPETKAAMAEYKRLKNSIHSKFPTGNQKVYYDKHIDPIKGSIFAFGTNKLWAMAQLNGEIFDYSVMCDIETTVPKFMFKRWSPHLENLVKGGHDIWKR